MQVDRVALLSVLLTVRPALANRPYLPALSHVLFAKGWATAYDEAIAITRTIDVKADDGLAVINACVPGEALIAALGQFTGERVDASVVDNALVLKQGKSRIKLALLPAGDFPFTAPDWEGATAVLNETLRDAFKACLVGAGKDTNLPATLGVTIAPEDGIMTTFSTDNRTITRFRTDVAWPLEWAKDVLLPSSFCEAVVGAFEPKRNACLLINDRFAIADLDNGSLVYARLQSDFRTIAFPPKVEGLCPDELLARSFPLPDGIDGALARAALVLDREKVSTVTMTMSRNHMSIDATSTTGTSHDEFVVDWDEDTFAFRVDVGMLARAIKLSDSVLPLPNVLALAGNKGDLLTLIAHVQA